MVKQFEGKKKADESLQKCPTGINGLDVITGGGLPLGRPTLLCGGSGCGKTLLAMEFLVRGVKQFEEPGVFVSFEENPSELAHNFASLGFELNDLVARKRLVLSYVHIEQHNIEETGEYNLEALFIRIGHAIDTIGAKRVVLDTIEALFSGLSNESILRAELRRLFCFLKEKGVTAIVTGEQGESLRTRYGLEEYVADCVIFLSHEVIEQIATRRMRIIKYRGSNHSTNDFPFLIDEQGISVMPITALGLDYQASTDRMTTGIHRLDIMLGGKGYYRGSSVLIAGTAGTGKSSMAANFVDASCRCGERCLYFAFEESQNQIVRNMLSIGIDLDQWVKKGLLKFQTTHPTMYGLEMHLVSMHKAIEGFNPTIVVFDPISNLATTASDKEIKSMLSRLIAYLKMKQITALFTDLLVVTSERTENGMSSLMDTWLLLRSIEGRGERSRGLYIIKSRGMEHSDQYQELVLSDQGVKLYDVYVGPDGVLTGASRTAQEAKITAEILARQDEVERKEREVERRNKALEAHIDILRAEFSAEKEELMQIIKQEKLRAETLAMEMAKVRKAGTTEAVIGKDGESSHKRNE